MGVSRHTACCELEKFPGEKEPRKKERKRQDKTRPWARKPRGRGVWDHEVLSAPLLA